MAEGDEKRGDVRLRMLKTPPTPHKPRGKGEMAADADPPPTNDPEALVEWGRRNVHND